MLSRQLINATSLESRVRLKADDCRGEIPGARQAISNTHLMKKSPSYAIKLNRAPREERVSIYQADNARDTTGTFQNHARTVRPLAPPSRLFLFLVVSFFLSG